MTEQLTRSGLRAKRRRARRRNRIAIAAASVLVTAGIAIGAASLLAPTETSFVVGGVVGEVRQQVQKVQTEIEHDGVPRVQLGRAGGQAELDACDGDFIHMADYQAQVTDLQPTYSAHNGCGGDVLLPWELGQLVDVVAQDGTLTRYTVTDSRDTPQFNTTAADITGLDGDLLLQTCYWVAHEMRFVALTETTA